MRCPGSSRFGHLPHAVRLSLCAFALHLVWELLQCPVFFAHGTYDATWRGMLFASLGDVGMTWLIYAAVALTSGRWRWDVCPWGVRPWATLVVASLAIALAVEVRGLDAGKWTYTRAMPVIPGLGVGLLPLVQMLVLTPLLIRLAARPMRARPAERV